MKKFGAIFAVFILTAVFISPLMVRADVFTDTAINYLTPCGDNPDQKLSPAAKELCVDISSRSALFKIMYSIIGLLRTIFWILAIGLILYAAYLYLIEGASSGKVDKANAVLKYAVIAIIIALVATSIPYLIRSILS